MSVVAKPKVLLVEDDRAIRMAIEAVLRSEFAVISAPDGQKALDLLATWKITQELPDLVLLDLIMPGVQGWQVLRTIKQDPATAAVPVIILSNLGQASDMEALKADGAAGYLIKSNIQLKTLAQQVKAMWKGTADASKPAVQ